MNKIKLIALDLDGTLFDNSGQISEANKKEIQRAVSLGVAVVISTGRPFMGLPFDQIKDSGIKYAITANGSAIYEIETGKCLYESPLPDDVVIPVINYILTKDIHADAFCGGKGYTSAKCLSARSKLDMPESLLKYIINTRKVVPDLVQYIKQEGLHVQKMTLNFHTDDNGILVDRDEVKNYLESNPEINTVCGGYNNLEFTAAGVDKGVGLKKLAGILSIPVENTMAVGDTENDIAILKAAGIGVAMGNATDEVKAIASYITTSNTEDGVANAIAHFVV